MTSLGNTTPEQIAAFSEFMAKRRIQVLEPGDRPAFTHPCPFSTTLKIDDQLVTFSAPTPEGVIELARLWEQTHADDGT